jgi:Ca2+-binding EF-hand superfamily protein
VKTRIMTAAVAAILAGSAGTAYAEITDVEIGLIKADVNGDQMLSKGEVMLDAMQGFVVSDLDGDGQLEATEVGDLAEHPEFTDNDDDKSGSLSVEEVVEEKLADFKAIDTDGDGMLSLDELNAAYPPSQE